MNKMFITMQEYSGPRIVNYRRRKLVIAYFTNDNTLKVACTTSAPHKPVSSQPQANFKPADKSSTNEKNAKKFFIFGFSLMRRF